MALVEQQGGQEPRGVTAPALACGKWSTKSRALRGVGVHRSQTERH